MANARTVQVQFLFLDRNNNTARATMYVPWTVAVEDVLSWAYSAATRLQLLSNAVLIRFDITYKFTVDNPPGASARSAVGRLLLMFIENSAGEINTLAIPSAAADIYELVGRYAGIRIDAAHIAVVAFAELLPMFDLRTDLNDPLGATLITGGVAI